MKNYFGSLCSSPCAVLLGTMIVTSAIFIGLLQSAGFVGMYAPLSADMKSLVPDDVANGHVKLGDSKYYYPRLKAPAASGFLLSTLSFILTQTPISAVLCRFLLNENGMHMLRQLSSQAPHIAPLSHPIARLSDQDHQEHDTLAARSISLGLGMQDVLQLPGSSMTSFLNATKHRSRVHMIYASYLTGEDDPVTAMKRLLNVLLPRLQDQYRAFVHIDKNQVLVQAEASRERWALGKPLSILDGVPIAVKDMIAVKGYKTTDGSEAKSGEMAEAAAVDADLVLRFKRLGAIILGTTTMTEGGVTPLGYCAFEKGPFNPFGSGMSRADIEHWQEGSTKCNSVLSSWEKDIRAKSFPSRNGNAAAAYAPVQVTNKLQRKGTGKPAEDVDFLVPWPFSRTAYEFCTNEYSQNESSHTAPPKQTVHYSGGSSSGSAVAVALGLCPIAIGFDGGGSIRIPSAWSGIVGLATTFGRLEHQHTYSTMIKGGPMAASVADAAIGYLAMTIPRSMIMDFPIVNPRNELNLPEMHFYTDLYANAKGLPQPHISGYLSDSPKMKTQSATRIGIFRAHFEDIEDAEIVERCYAALELLETRQDIEVVEIEIPNLAWFRLAHASRITAEFAQEWDTIVSTQGSKVEANTRITVTLGQTMNGNELLAIDRLRRYLFDFVRREIFGPNGKQIDAIVSPVLPMVAPQMPASSKDFFELGESNVALVVEMMKFIFLANFVGLPGISLPIGYSTNKAGSDQSLSMPISLQLVGAHWAEHKLLGLAAWLEAQL